MSFQAYIDNIKKKTSNGPDDFKKLVDKKGFTENGRIKPGVKAGEIVNGLKKNLIWGMGIPWRYTPYSKGSKKQESNQTVFQTLVVENNRAK